jgi:hypothetical protein
MLTLQDLLRTRTAQPPLNKALYFNGVNNYVLVSSSVIGSVVSSAPLSINVLLFMFPDYGRVYTYASTYLQAYYGFVLQKTSNNYLIFCVGTGTSWVVPIVPVSSPGWMDATGVIGASIVYFYVNASLVGASSLPRYQPGSTTLGIGSHPVNPPFVPARTYIARVLLYSRTLSASEIIHNMSNPNNPVRDGLVLWLDARACDASKNMCYDLSGSGNHGTMYNVQIVTLPNPVVVGGVM